MRAALLASILLVLVLGVMEAMAFVASGLLAGRGLLLVPADASGYADYVARRDPVVGWPSRESFGQGERDTSGSRRVPSHPDPAAPSCVAVFGDSFTWGDEAEAEHAYPNVLAERLGCRVANHGTPGYGSDQAFLRYRDVIDDPAPVVVLGHYVENVVRNVNQYRGYYTGRGDFGLKPRFVVDGSGALQLIPIPALDEAEFRELAERSDVLPHEYFRLGGDAGVARRRFPYLLATARAFTHYRMRARLAGVPSYAAFYRADHASNGLAVTLGILGAFDREARARGQRPLVLLIPDEKDLALLAGGEPVSYASLTSALEQAGIRPLDAAPGLLAAAGGESPCALYTRCDGGHFNPKGYAALARLVEDRIGPI